EAEKVLGMVPLKHPDAPFLPMKMPSPDEICLFRVTPASGRTRPDHRRSQFDPQPSHAWLESGQSPVAATGLRNLHQKGESNPLTQLNRPTNSISAPPASQALS